MIRKGLFLIAYLVGVLFTISVNRAGATAFQLIATKDEYRSQLQGDWEVKTTVIWSDSPYVKVGNESESELSIMDINGHLYPKWIAGDWKLLKNTSIDFNKDKSLYWERESILEIEKELWRVQSVNKFDFDQLGQFTALSHHKQFLNDEYVGTYITQSTLTKKEEIKVSKL